ncbi:MAG TPA: patatin-like phospholipase family protein [Candidatus Sulfotelmatobacter sp.]|nr:patatin-like phospholipase family protein [Candidatus Sulfotelmatobacter sp.]
MISRKSLLALATRVASVFLVASILSSFLFAAPDASTAHPKKPRLGLVLEGGGALGLAHVGVLLWLEEHHIPISYVAGTSMGGLVGGVYAAGNSAVEARDLVKGIKWNAVLDGETPFEELTFRRKEDERDYPNNLEFGLRKGLHFPEGFNSGQEVSLILDPIALPYSELTSFDDLPTPFACVATDLVTNQKYVFRSGSLALALRSTMSIPGFFTPLRWNGHVFVDGGLLDNLPVDVAKGMGADITLAIHLQVKQLDSDHPMSAFGVLGQSVTTVIAANELRSMEDADLLVSVPLQNFSSSDYVNGDAIIEAGYKAIDAKGKMLSGFSVDDTTWTNYLAERASRRRTTPTPQFINVAGTNAFVAQSIQKELAPVIGKPIDTADLADRILNLDGMGRFSNINYQMSEINGLPGLQIHVEEKAYVPPAVRPLILIDGSEPKSTLFNLGARVTFFDLGGFRSELRNDIILFSHYGIRSEYYHPFSSTSNWFFASRGIAENDPLYLYENSNQIGTYRQFDGGGGMDIGYQIRKFAELRAGYEGGWQQFTKESGSPVLPTVSGAYADFRLQYKLDRLDDPAIPRRGQFLLADWRWYHTSPISSNQYPAGEIASQNFFKISDPSSIFLNGYGGTTFDYATALPQFSLGGSNRLAAYEPSELRMDKYFLFQLGGLRELKKLPPLLGGGLYGLLMYEAGQAFGSPVTGLGRFPNYPMDGVAGIAVKTLFGPVEFAYAYGDTGHHRFSFRIGRLF